MSNRDMNPTAHPLRWGRLLLLSVVLPVVSGCYQYAPVASQALPANADVRARLSDAEIERLGFREIVPIEERTFEGKVVQNGPDTLALLVHVTSAQDWGFRDREINQRLSIPWNSILELELKEGGLKSRVSPARFGAPKRVVPKSTIRGEKVFE